MDWHPFEFGRNPEVATKYIEEVLMPRHREMRENGQITAGGILLGHAAKQIKIAGYEYTYTGEQDP